MTFVTTFAVREESWPSYHRPKRWVEPKFYVNPKLKIDSTALTKISTKIHASLPQPECTPENAMYHLRDTKGLCGRYKGRLISSVTIDHHPDKDDDTAIIEFGPPDPAVSRFRVRGNPTKPPSTEPDVTSK